MKKKLPGERLIDIPVNNLGNIFTEGLEFSWLGQSGFIFSTGTFRILIDAYLSNYLESNHGDLPYEHNRMISPPVEDTVLNDIDYVLITHGHEDHLDPDLIRKLAAVNSEVMYLIPPGCRSQLLSLGVNKLKIREIIYGQNNKIDEGFSIDAYPSAHPEPILNPDKVWALSYKLLFNGISIFFAGDTTIYPGLMEWLRSHSFDLLILPVNGRDSVMESNGIVGNMNLEEGIALSAILQTPMLGTHFGMFKFNTIDTQDAINQIRNFGLNESVALTELSVVYSM